MCGGLFEKPYGTRIKETDVTNYEANYLSNWDERRRDVLK